MGGWISRSPGLKTGSTDRAPPSAAPMGGRRDPFSRSDGWPSRSMSLAITAPRLPVYAPRRATSSTARNCYIGTPGAAEGGARSVGPVFRPGNRAPTPQSSPRSGRQKPDGAQRRRHDPLAHTGLLPPAYAGSDWGVDAPFTRSEDRVYRSSAAFSGADGRPAHPCRWPSRRPTTIARPCAAPCYGLKLPSTAMGTPGAAEGGARSVGPVFRPGNRAPTPPSSPRRGRQKSLQPADAGWVWVGAPQTTTSEVSSAWDFLMGRNTHEPYIHIAAHTRRVLDEEPAALDHSSTRGATPSVPRRHRTPVGRDSPGVELRRGSRPSPRGASPDHRHLDGRGEDQGMLVKVGSRILP